MEAETNIAQQEQLRDLVREALTKFQQDIDNSVQELGGLARQYASMSLSGSFARQVEKSVELLKLNLETVRGNGTSSETIKAVEQSLKELEAQLDVLKKAQADAKSQNKNKSIVRTVAGFFHRS